jgi:hypothetical protein
LTDIEKRTFVWTGVAFSIAVGAAVIALAVFGTKKGVALGLVTTGRIAFVFFFLAYVGGPLTTLFGAVFAPLRKRGREFGLAFAAVILVHLSLIATLCVFGHAPGLNTFLVFGPAAAFTALLTLLSFSRVQRLLPETFWPPIRTIATTYILYAFTSDFLNFSSYSSLLHLIAYVPFAALAVMSLLMKFAAWGKDFLGSAAIAHRGTPRVDQLKGRPKF